MNIFQKLNTNSFLNVLNSFSKTSLCKLSSSSDEIVFLKIDDDTQFAKILLNRPPVNSITPEFFSGIAKAVEEAENSKCRGIILTSVNSLNFVKF